MANLIIQENGVVRIRSAVHGEEITIQTPCDCSAVEGVQIAGVAYPFYDAAGKPLPTGTGLFSEGSLIRVLIDTVNTRATIINHAITPASIGAATTAAVQTAQTTANSKASTASYTVSVPVTWAEDATNGGFTQTVSVSGILATDNPIADVVLGSDVEANALYLAAWALVTRITTAAGSITLYANGSAPETAFTVQLKAVR